MQPRKTKRQIKAERAERESSRYFDAAHRAAVEAHNKVRDRQSARAAALPPRGKADRARTTLRVGGKR